MGPGFYNLDLNTGLDASAVGVSEGLCSASAVVMHCSSHYQHEYKNRNNTLNPKPLNP